MANKIKIEVYGSRYFISTQEDEGYVLALAGELDERVTQLMTGNSLLSISDALVLCALNYIDLYKKAEVSADNIRSRLTDYLEDAARARAEAEESRRELERLRERLNRLEHSTGAANGSR